MNTMGTVLLQLDTLSLIQKNQMKGIKYYMKKKNVPLDIIRRVLKYVEYMQEK
jgi:hypothetical protein